METGDVRESGTFAVVPTMGGDCTAFVHHRCVLVGLCDVAVSSGIMSGAACCGSCSHLLEPC